MNLPKFLPFLKHALLAITLVAVVGISGCDDDEPDGPTIFDGTIMGLIKTTDYKQSASVPADQALDSLVKFLEYHDLDGTLEGAGPFTLFAPSNAAFANLVATPGFPADIRKINPAIVKGVLSYHVVSGTNLKSALTDGVSLSTLFTGTANNPDDKIIVNANGTLKTGSSDQAIVISKADLQANNGVVHITNKVLIPQTVGASLTPILGTIAGTVLLAADFTYMAKLIANADQGVAVGSRISTMLATPNPNANPADATSTIRKTFFAVPNGVFAQAAGGAANVDAFLTTLGTGQASAAYAILLNHLITTDTKKYYVVTDVAGTTDDIVFSAGALANPTGAGKTLTVAITAPNAAQFNPYGVVLVSPSTPASQAPIASKDIVAVNGVIQVVAGILKPQ